MPTRASFFFQATHPAVWEHQAITSLQIAFLFLPTFLATFNFFVRAVFIVVCVFISFFFFWHTPAGGASPKQRSGDASTPGAPSGRSTPSKERKRSTAHSTRWALRIYGRDCLLRAHARASTFLLHV